MKSAIGIVVDKELVQMTKTSAINMLNTTVATLKLVQSLQKLVEANNLDVPEVLKTDLSQNIKTYEKEIYLIKEAN